eukprot:6450990-Pyramimonas_sp.AAC.1
MAQDVARMAAPRRWERALRLAIGTRAMLLRCPKKESGPGAPAEPRRSEPTRADFHWRPAALQAGPRLLRRARL